MLNSGVMSIICNTVDFISLVINTIGPGRKRRTPRLFVPSIGAGSQEVLIHFVNGGRPFTDLVASRKPKQT